MARLPNIRTLNGGDPVSEVEREQAERAFIRAFLDTEPGARPGRWAELVAVHGELEPLVKIDLTPETGRYHPAGTRYLHYLHCPVFRVGVWHGDSEHVLHVSVRQRVKHLKTSLASLFPVAASCMRLWYYDQDLWRSAGPQEMKWPMKGNLPYPLGPRVRGWVESPWRRMVKPP